MEDDIEIPPAVLSAGDPLASAETAPVEALRGVLSRHRRQQATAAVGALAAVLFVGTIAGFAVGQHDQPTSVVAAAAPKAPTPKATADEAAPAIATVGSAAYGSADGGPWTQLVVRDGGGARIRLYRSAPATPTTTCAPAAACTEPAIAVCASPGLLQAEVSDDQVAGTALGPIPTSPGDGTPIIAEVIGGAQPQPILAIAAQAKGSAPITVTTAYGKDTATPTKDGWVALAVALPAGFTAAPDAATPAYTLTRGTGSTATTIPTTAQPITGCGVTPPCAVTVTPPDAQGNAKIEPATNGTAVAPAIPVPHDPNDDTVSGSATGSGSSAAGSSAAGSSAAGSSAAGSSAAGSSAAGSSTAPACPTCVTTSSASGTDQATTTCSTGGDPGAAPVPGASTGGAGTTGSGGTTSSGGAPGSPGSAPTAGTAAKPG